MKQKERYTLQELYENLPITLTELSKLTGKSHGTLTRIRGGEPTRRSTVNKLLIILSEVYKLDLSLDNVTGIVLEERQEKAAEKAKNRSISDSSPQKRAYTTAESIPTNWVLCSDFFEAREIKETTYRRWLRDGLGGENFEFEERPRPSKADKFRYFTPAQQEQALEILKRHGKLKTTEPEEKPALEEPAWYLPEQEKAMQHTPRKIDIAPPDGFTYLSDFCLQHHVPYQAAADLFPRAIHGQPIKVGKRNYPVIGPRGRHDFYVQLHTRPDFVTCDDCPHESE